VFLKQGENLGIAEGKSVVVTKFLRVGFFVLLYLQMR